MPHTATMRVIEKTAAKRFTLGIVYAPDSVDTQNEFAKAEDIESAAWEFLARLQALAKGGALVLRAAQAAGADGVTVDVTELGEALAKGAGLDDQHLQVGDDADLGTIVESYVAPADFESGGQAVTKGTWLLGVVWSQEMFDKIVKGQRTGLSMFGTARRAQEAA